MTRRERVNKALSFEETDIVPYNCPYCGETAIAVDLYTKQKDYYSTIGDHMLAVGYNPEGLGTSREGLPIDGFGTVWNGSVVAEYVLKDYSDLDTYEFPKIDEVKFRKKIDHFLNTCEDKFRMGSVNSMFERAWEFRGMENLLMDMLIEPEWVHRLLDRICEYNLKIIDILVEYDIDGVYFGDDWGQQKGLIMGPKLWREFIKPQMAKMYARVKEKGLWVLQHSCGDISEIMDDAIEIGLNCYQTVQPEIYDLALLKSKYHNRLAFWGGISTQRDLPFKTPDEIREITKETIKIMGKGGGYIAAPTHVIDGIPPENLIAMLDVFRNNSIELDRSIGIV